MEGQVDFIQTKTFHSHKMPKLTQPSVGDKICVNGAGNDVFIDPFSVNEHNDARYQNGNHGADDMPTQLFNMVDKRHLARLRVVAVFQESVK